MKKTQIYLAPDLEWSEIEQEGLLCVSGDGENEGYEYEVFPW